MGHPGEEGGSIEIKKEATEGRKVFKALLIADIPLCSTYALSGRLLGMFQLAYRNIVNYTVYVALALITLLIAIQAAGKLSKRAKRKQGNLQLEYFPLPA